MFLNFFIEIQKMIKKGMKSKPKLISGRNIKGTDDGEDNRNKKSPKVKDTIPESSIIENTKYVYNYS